MPISTAAATPDLAGHNLADTEAADPGAPPPVAPASRRRRIVKRTLGGAALTAVLAAAGGYLWLDATSDPEVLGRADCTAVAATGAHPGDQRAVCATLRSLTDAWGRADAIAYGAQFTADATYTTYVGTHYQGRRDIADAHRALFAGFVEGTRLADSFLGIRFYGTGTAIVTSRGDTYTGDRPSPADLTKTQTYTLVRESDGRWRIAAFHNTKRQNVMERLSFLWDPATAPKGEK